MDTFPDLGSLSDTELKDLIKELIAQQIVPLVSPFRTAPIAGASGQRLLLLPKPDRAYSKHRSTHKRARLASGRRQI